MRGLALTALTMACGLALGLSGCMSSAPANVDGLRAVVGTQLAGALGRTDADQDKIDRTVARLCGGGVWERPACDAHTRAVAGSVE